MRKTVFILLKIFLSLGFLFFALSHFDRAKIYESLINLDKFYVVIAVFLNIISIALAAKRWKSSLNVRIATFRLTYAGAFLSQVLPGSVGGDAYRIYALKKNNISLKSGLLNLLCDRAMGVCTLFFWGCTTIFVSQAHPYIKLMNVIVVGGALCVVILNYFFCFAPLNKRMFFWSCASSFFYLLVPYFIAKSMHLSLPWFEFFSFFPTVLLFISLPISFAGWGVREAILIKILSDFHIIPEKSIAFSITVGSVIFLSTLPASLLLFSKKCGLIPPRK